MVNQVIKRENVYNYSQTVYNLKHSSLKPEDYIICRNILWLQNNEIVENILNILTNLGTQRETLGLHI